MIGLSLDQIRTDGGTQPRAILDPSWVKEYAVEMVEGAEFPPVIVFFDGTYHWLADGFHRYHGAKSIGLAEIAADVRQGDREDAVIFSLGANAAHGMRRTNEDKRRAVVLSFKVARLRGKSDGEIARICAVHQTFVSKLRREISQDRIEMAPAEREVTRGGKTYTMNTAGIGSERTPREPKAVDEEIAEPDAPDPQQGEAFALAAAVGGRLRDLQQIMDAHPAREVAWAFRNSPMSSPARFLAQARRVAAFLAEIETALEDTDEQAA